MGAITGCLEVASYRERFEEHRYICENRPRAIVDGFVLYNASMDVYVKRECMVPAWQVINILLSYQPDEELNSSSGKDMQSVIQFLASAPIGQAAARIVSMN